MSPRRLLALYNGHNNEGQHNLRGWTDGRVIFRKEAKEILSQDTQAGLSNTELFANPRGVEMDLEAN
jgi:hypothetical protein